MPRVPLYQQQQTLRAAPDVRMQPVRSGLADAGAALQQAGAGLDAIALRKQERRNADQVFRAEAALKDEYLQFETSLRERRGEKAHGVTDDVAKWFESAAERHDQVLENDAQRTLFRQTAVQMRQRSMAAASRFEESEMRASLEDAANAAIENSINLAAASYADPDAIADALDDVDKRVRVQAGFNGWPPERLEAELTTQRTALHTRVIEAMVDADPAGAREYYRENREQIAGASRAGLKELIDEGTLRAKAQDRTDAIVAKGLTETDALAEARKISDDQERDEVVSRVKVRYREMEAAKAQREKDLADEAWDIFAREGRVSALPTKLLDELDGRTLQALKNAESGDTTEDWDYYYTMLQDAREDPEAFAQRDLRQDFPNLSAAQRGSVLKLQEDLREPARLPDAGTLVQQINVAEQLLDLKKTEDKGKLEFAVRQEVAAFIQRTGKEPTYDERQQIIDRLMIEGEGRFWFSGPRFFEVVGTEAEADFVPVVPDAERAKIIEALQRNGSPVTDEIVTTIYRAAQGL